MEIFEKKNAFLVVFYMFSLPECYCPGEKKHKEERASSYSHLRDSEAIHFQLQGSKTEGPQ